jgi:glycosyltransferase involved in cell wall biosynthesis
MKDDASGEPKIAIVHDHLGWKGGGERTSLLLAKAIGADYITAYADAATYPDLREQMGARFRALAGRPIRVRGVRFFWLRWIFWKNRGLLGGYDILIASGQPALEAVAAYAKKDASRIVYNHTPPRRVFDLYEESRRRYPRALRPLFSLFIAFWRFLYLRALDRTDYDICNSETVRKRLIKFTGRDANEIVRPPIMTETFRHLADGDYYLSWARLDEAKRVETIVEAFTKMPQEKLVVASDGIMMEACKKIAAGAGNIEFVGAVSDAELARLAGSCRAAIYIPKDEDAGMTHLEANAAGKPVLVSDEGGVGETAVDGETAIKIKADPKPEDVIAGIKRMSKEWCSGRKEACRAYAEQFSYEHFAAKIRQAVKANDPRLPLVGIDASRWEDPRHPGENRRSGVEIYASRMIEALYGYLKDKPVRLRFYVPRAIPSLPLSLQKTIPARRFWTMRALSSELRHNPPHSFFTPSYVIPAHAPEASFAVIHDIAFESHPLRYSAADWLGQHMAWSANKARAKSLIAVSRSTLKDIVRRHPRLAEKTSFVPPGYAPDPLFRSGRKESAYDSLCGEDRPQEERRDTHQGIFHRCGKNAGMALGAGRVRRFRKRQDKRSGCRIRLR